MGNFTGLFNFLVYSFFEQLYSFRLRGVIDLYSWPFVLFDFYRVYVLKLCYFFKAWIDFAVDLWFSLLAIYETGTI